ncbi:unnamed protein product [Bemisia tabaci]|uniref:B9 domain-containing protein 1 n=1 Tax=Bemisia tabaci TaxID=7038 RepID=A0A9P0F262_BEMTA|nr:PREDICTED: B9 domain-containing protein 1 [Bemisia tabaci]CAH0385187.1 unnamed protein product [Bemisia tabaci]
MTTQLRTVGFLVSVSGQIKTGDFPGCSKVYCKYSFTHGTDWEMTSGIDEGITQTSKKSQDDQQIFVWNFPIEITFRSTNPYGWPQLILSVFGLDSFGNDTIQGYGVCHIPISTGNHSKSVAMYVPESSSLLQKLTSWLTGRRPEFIDPKVIGQGAGREVTRVRSQGRVILDLNVLTKDFGLHGYDNVQRSAISGSERGHFSRV